MVKILVPTRSGIVNHQHHYVPAQEASCDVVLLCQAGEPHSGLDLFIFLRGHPEGHGLVPPAIFVVSVFQ